MSSSSIKARHLDQILSVANRADARDLIATSWRRCLDVHRLDPERKSSIRVLKRKSSIRVLTGRELLEARKPLDYLLSFAEGPLSDLYRQVSSAGYMVMLTDARGIALSTKVFGSAEPFGRWGLCTGAVWSEESEGTNGVGVCLTEERPVTVHRDQHFKTDYVGLTCTVAPIFDQVGRLLGALDISSSDARIDDRVIAFAQAATNHTAMRIEAEYFMRCFANCWVASIGESYEGRALVAFDKDRRLVGANRLARTVLGLNDQALARGVEVVEQSFRNFPLNSPSLVIDGQSAFLDLGKSCQIELPRHGSTPRRQRLSSPSLQSLAGGDAQILAALRRVAASARLGIPVMIFGETGTGKELFALALHDAVGDPQEPFVRVDCDELSQDRSRHELEQIFNQRVAEAAGGTLFLDGLNQLSVPVQAGLLQLLEAERSARAQPSVRIISATRELDSLVQAGSFRPDLYYLLKGATLHLPPIRNRADKKALILRFLYEINPSVGITQAASDALSDYHWPGNIRELIQVLRVAVAASAGSEIQTKDLDFPEASQVRIDGQPLEGQPAIEVAEKAVIVKELEADRSDVAKTAAALGMSRATLYRRIKRFGL